MSPKDCSSFLCQFFLKPGAVGALLPSSRSLGRRMVEWIDWPQVGTVVEYGPGTGAFTRQILSRKGHQSRFFAIEINPRFAAALKDRFRDEDVRIYQDSVKNVREICRTEGIDQVDAIVCGLPWAAFGERDQSDILDAMMAVLSPGGHFATFAYLQGLLLPAGKRFRSMLRNYFSRIEESRTAWGNVPPAFVYRCIR